MTKGLGRVLSKERVVEDGKEIHFRWGNGVYDEGKGNTRLVGRARGLNNLA